jgi:hypothetical protein
MLASEGENPTLGGICSENRPDILPGLVAAWESICLWQILRHSPLKTLYAV